MALIKCPECGKDVSDAAVSCPHCGHPLSPPPTNTAAAAPTSRTKGLKAIGSLVLLGLIVVIAIASANRGHDAPQTPSCKSDWTLCTDNADMANNYSGWRDGQVQCKSKANDQARFGTPEWPWLAFLTFQKGNNYASDGIATLAEPDAKFSNGFGAMVHSKVICEYDLRTKKVINVSVSIAR